MPSPPSTPPSRGSPPSGSPSSTTPKSSRSATSQGGRPRVTRSRSGPRSGLISTGSSHGSRLDGGGSSHGGALTRPINDGSATGMGQSSSGAHTSARRTRQLPGRSKSANNPGAFGRSQSARRVTVSSSGLLDDDDFNLEDFASSVGPTRQSFGGAGSRYVRSAVASAANTTQTTLFHEEREKKRSSSIGRSQHQQQHQLQHMHRQEKPKQKQPVRRTQTTPMEMGRRKSKDTGSSSSSTSPELGPRPPLRKQLSAKRKPPTRSSGTNKNPMMGAPPDILGDESTSLHADEGLLAVSAQQHTQSSRRSMHNSAVAQRFLEETDDEFDLSGSKFPTQSSLTSGGGGSGSGAKDPLLNMSQLKFPTITGSGEIFDDPNDDPKARYKKQQQSGRGRGGDRHPSSVFDSLADLRNVDQSVNLMDVETAKYDSPGGRKNKKNSTRHARRSSITSLSSKMKNRQSMVEVFLGEQTADSPFNPKNKKFRNMMYNRTSANDEEDETCWEQFVRCIQLFFRILCSLPMLIFVCIVGSGLILIPMILEEQPQPPADTIETPAPTTTALAPTPPSTTTVATTVDANANTNGAEAKSLFDATQVEARIKALQDILSEADLEDYGEAGLQALNWMAAYDPAMIVLVESSTPAILERFAMASLYFAMNPNVSADSASIALGTISVGQQERQAGRHLSIGRDDGWMSATGICEWRGIDCENNHVVHLNVSHSNLRGSLPEELTLLTELIELDLSHNEIHGSLPASYPTKLNKLEYVWLHANQVGGSLPASIGDWSTVYHLDVSENELVGSLPKELAKLTQIRLLYMHQNKFQGSIPLELGHLPNIEYLYLGQNDLTGELPMDLLSRLSTIVDLRLDNNLLSGTMPPELESLHRLEFLSLANNKLNGELPDIFDRLHYLVEMDLHKNSFRGHLPQSIGKATSLELLLLEQNNLSGPIPTSWSDLTALEKLGLDHNEITGTVPLCSLTELNFLAADCLSKVDCDCCQKCY